MSEMVERVARALNDLAYSRQEASWSQDRWLLFVPHARAAIAAMRDPTPEMIQAALDAAVDADCQHDPTPDLYWRAMIDKAGA
jgi:hypothetical protein